MSQIIHEASSAHGSDEAKRPRRRVLMCPFTNPTNRYIEIQKDLYRSVGYDVAPLSIKGLLKGGFADLFKPENVLVFHWLEYRPFRRQKGTAQLSFGGSLLFAFYCSLMLLGRAKVVYFVHDQAVHDTEGFNRRLSMRIIAFVRRLAIFAWCTRRTFRCSTAPSICLIRCIGTRPVISRVMQGRNDRRRSIRCSA